MNYSGKVSIIKKSYMQVYSYLPVDAIAVCLSQTELCMCEVSHIFTVQMGAVFTRKARLLVLQHFNNLSKNPTRPITLWILLLYADTAILDCKSFCCYLFPQENISEHSWEKLTLFWTQPDTSLLLEMRNNWQNVALKVEIWRKSQRKTDDGDTQLPVSTSELGPYFSSYSCCHLQPSKKPISDFGTDIWKECK